MTPEELKVFVAMVAAELKVQKGSDEHEVDDDIQAFFDKEPDEFLARVSIETAGLSLSERRRIRKGYAIEADDHAQSEQGFLARKWRNVAYALRSTRTR
tara:strand:+ start:287 stop:583 length:297 start_codon:yes stop_codon:yes gene_type:complete